MKALVNDLISWILGHLGASPQLTYASGEWNWVGNSPSILLGCRHMRSLSWKPELTIREGIIRAVNFLPCNQWVSEARK